MTGTHDNRHAFPFIAALLRAEPPPHLHHYTSPAGLIGILERKVIWATALPHLNDDKEVILAYELAALYIENELRVNQSAYSSADRLFLEQLRTRVSAASDSLYAVGRAVYVVSLSAEGDSLAQWRAYSPPSGGYAIGFPSAQLRAVAQEQDFFLVRCLYENAEQYRLVAEVVDHHLATYRDAIARTQDALPDNQADRLTANAADDLAKYGAAIKHRSFAHEQEWRLIAWRSWLKDDRFGFRAGQHGVIPHFDFDLVTQSHPHLAVPGDNNRSLRVRVGPTIDNLRAQSVVQMLLENLVGPGCGWGPSDSSFRGY